MPRSGKYGKLMLYAPIVLEVLNLLRRQQRSRSKYTKARKRDRALDFLLGQAERKLGGKSRRRWF